MNADGDTEGPEHVDSVKAKILLIKDWLDRIVDLESIHGWAIGMMALMLVRSVSIDVPIFVGVGILRRLGLLLFVVPAGT